MSSSLITPFDKLPLSIQLGLSQMLGRVLKTLREVLGLLVAYESLPKSRRTGLPSLDPFCMQIVWNSHWNSVNL